MNESTLNSPIVGRHVCNRPMNAQAATQPITTIGEIGQKVEILQHLATEILSGSRYLADKFLGSAPQAETNGILPNPNGLLYLLIEDLSRIESILREVRTQQSRFDGVF